MTSSTNSPRRKRSSIAAVASVIVVLLIVALVGGEFYARNRIQSCLAGQLESELGSQIDVTLGLQPVLLSLLTKKVSSVDIDSDDSKFGPAQDMTVHATFNDIDLAATDNSSGSIGSSSADVSWSTSGIMATLAGQGIGGLVSGVTSDATAGTLDFAVLGGLAQLNVRPAVVGDRIEVTTDSAQIFGFGIPTDLADSVVSVLTDSLQAYPLGLTPQSVEVTDSGLNISMTGGEFTIPPAQDGQQAISC